MDTNDGGRGLRWALAWGWGLGVGVGVVLGGPIPVPNGSFESPPTVFVSTPVDGWQKTPKPPGYVEGGGFTWEQLTGVFRNTAPGRFDHIANCDGAQALFLFAVPEAGLVQDTLPHPSGEGLVRYTVGSSYRLTVGVIGGGGGMPAGAALELGLSYLDEAGVRALVAGTRVVHDPAVFTSITNLVDFTVTMPAVAAGEAWAGRPLGITLMSAREPADAAGYWDLDQVRLEELAPPGLSGWRVVDGRFSFEVRSDAGSRVEIWVGEEPSGGAAGWVSRGRFSNPTGTLVHEEPVVAGGARYYRAELIP